MKTFVLLTALCLGAILLPGAAEAHTYTCVDEYYVEAPTGSTHVHEKDCYDPATTIAKLLQGTLI